MGSVLIIDDEQSILQVFDYALSRCGFKVETAVDGREGLQKFLSGRFDLVVTDVLLQGMDGRDILKSIRCSERRQTPVIGMSVCHRPTGAGGVLAPACWGPGCVSASMPAKSRYPWTRGSK